MFKSKRRSKQEPKDTSKENETKTNPYKGQLFSEADAKSMELSGYWSTNEANQSDPLTPDQSLPVGVVGVDKSVKLPPISPKSNTERKTNVKSDQEQPTLPIIKYPSFNPNKPNNFRPPLYASPIASDNSQYVQISSFNDETSTPRSHRHSHHKHKHHHHHHHHHHSHRHHRHHLQDLETHDPRWWYLPSGTVHAPRPNQSPFYAHYEPPRWYEPSSSRGKFVIDTQSFGQTVRLYDDCRCEVCRPSRKTPRGYRWVVHQ